MNNQPFRSAPILLPDLDDLKDFAVVACDQYSSQPEYWEEVEKRTEGKPSALQFILPEAWLNTDKGGEHLNRISFNMNEALNTQFFREYPSSYIYVERTLTNGSVRQGLVGMVDLETYDFHEEQKSPIRATEATIIERIPPRVAVRENASLEISHILLLADDADDVLLHPIAEKAASGTLPLLYDFDLMMEGGHISGWLVDSEHAEAFDQVLEDYSSNIQDRYPGLDEDSLVFVVGDGNHSLATAKTIWENLKPSLSPEERENHPARFALAELENIHHDSQQFEPIHRIVKNTDIQTLLQSVKAACALAGTDVSDTPDEIHRFPVRAVASDYEELLWLDPERGELACQILQNVLDEYLRTAEGEIDYIHGEKEVRDLAARENSIGFILPAIDKSSLFRGVISGGSLPRKTFSMGHANEKRFYLEGKKIR